MLASTIILSLGTLAPAACEPSPDVRGALVLEARRVERLPDGDRFGTQNGWLGEDTTAFDVRVRDDHVEVRALYSLPPPGEDAFQPAPRPVFEVQRVRLVLGPDASHAEAHAWTDFGVRPVLDLAGVAVLLTDGRRTAVEFVLGAAWGASPHVWFGRVQLQDAGLALASVLLARDDSAPAERFWRSREIATETRTGVVTARGWIDARERRQGPWTLCGETGDRALVTTWRDGRLDGPVTTWSEGGLGSLFVLHDGLRDGSEQAWSPTGELRSVRSWGDGAQHGADVSWHRNGVKSSEQDHADGCPVGSERRWDDDGRLVSDEPSLMGVFLGEPAERRARHARFRAELTELLGRLAET